MAKTADARGPGRVAQFLESPFVGLSPWIVFSLLVGPGRFEWAVGLALAISVALVVVGRLTGSGGSVKILEVADVVFFAILTVVGAFASDGTRRWLETYAGEVANLALVVIALGSMAVRMPFTLQYAREQVDPQHWQAPSFIRTNYVITGVWALAFMINAAVGAYGDLVLHNPDNIWTGWIIQVVTIIGALRFTQWYPDVVRARAGTGRPPPPLSSMLLPLAGLLVPVGIAVLIFDSHLWWLGVALVVIGGWLSRLLKRQEATAAADARGDPLS
ncbi:hypothetical protein AMK16_01905 [Streptomyces sp. CB00455]|uniref:hypothetical protein n=1 Tax=Streptomyces sp. CB00455 TaxID=1703927 RepID=UPI000938DF9F|nr:hypothetical protein [Streptomyces sp. CB00455]OKK22017.1 hypothetical protein AMK16_01905 [Streptomyces sp. CB00455]